MTPEEFKPISDAMNQAIDEAYPDKIDKHAALVWLNSLILILFINEFPVKSPKFPECLHILANTLQIMIEAENKKK